MEPIQKNVKIQQKEEVKKSIKQIGNHPVIESTKTVGQKASDKLTKWAGSWTFIIAFIALVIVWIYINITLVTNYGKEAFDPFPFILLNLALSLLAAIQAPIILMSQNRQSEKDRLRAEYDYATNRRAEREILQLQRQVTRIERKLNGTKPNTTKKLQR